MYFLEVTISELLQLIRISEIMCITSEVCLLKFHMIFQYISIFLGSDKALLKKVSESKNSQMSTDLREMLSQMLLKDKYLENRRL